MTMIEVNSVDAVPGEAELLAVAADYFASRLFTLRQRRTLSVMVDITSQQVRVPVTRACLARSGQGWHESANHVEMTVSTAAGSVMRLKQSRMNSFIFRRLSTAG